VEQAVKMKEAQAFDLRNAVCEWHAYEGERWNDHLETSES